MQEHRHSFSPELWPFSKPVNTGTFCTGRVANHGYPILHVSHDEDDDWQFLDGTTEEAEECVLLCFGCVFDRDRTIAELADLPVGWMAWRDSPTQPWTRFPSPAGPEE
jgi:hypothetical protein